jgi:hypothetical protein
METDLKPRARFLWGMLALLIFVVAWLLTRLITHVDHHQQATVGVTIDERSPYRFDLTHVTLMNVRRALPRIPSIVVVGPQAVAIVVTPTLKSVAISGVGPTEISCTALDRALENGPVSTLLREAERGSLVSLPVASTPSGISIVVPDGLQRALASIPAGRGLITCKTAHTLAARPTFSERALTLRASNELGGSIMLDISALEDITELRFAGGVDVPFAGDRTRLLTGEQNVVAVDWVDGSAQEERDIILVVIGALAAIGAAMAIETIRPFIER